MHPNGGSKCSSQIRIATSNCLEPYTNHLMVRRSFSK